MESRRWRHLKAMTKWHIPKGTAHSRAFAKELRREMTPPEKKLWVHIRRNALGVKFRRQTPAGPFILDFYCPELRLAIEVDGANWHNSSTEDYDWYREARLAEMGIRVIRYTNREIRDDLQSVLLSLIAEVNFLSLKA